MKVNESPDFQEELVLAVESQPLQETPKESIRVPDSQHEFETIVCCVWENPASNAHSCAQCLEVCHAMCGVSTSAGEGYGMPVTMCGVTDFQALSAAVCVRCWIFPYTAYDGFELMLRIWNPYGLFWSLLQRLRFHRKYQLFLQVRTFILRRLDLLPAFVRIGLFGAIRTLLYRYPNKKIAAG